MNRLTFFSLLSLLSINVFAQKQIDMAFPFLQGAVSEVFTDKVVLIEGESANLEVQVAKQNVDAFEYDGAKVYDCSWALQAGHGSFNKSIGGNVTFKTPSNLPVATEVATITATLNPTTAAQNKAQKAGFTFAKVILYIRIQEVNKEMTVLSFNDEVFTVEMKSNIQSPENMMNYYQQKYAGSLTPEQKAQFEAANAKIAAAKTQGQAKATAANSDLMAMSMNQIAILKEGKLIVKINTGGSYFNLQTGLLETTRDVMYMFTIEQSKGKGTYAFPGTVGALSVGTMYCACDADGKCLEGTSGTFTIEEMGEKPGDKVKGSVHAVISDGMGNFAKIDGHFVVVIGVK